MRNLSEATAMATGQPALPDDLALGPVHIVVTDADRSIDFYERAIGLRLHRRESETARLGAGAEDLLVLHANPNAHRAGRHAGLYHFALLHPTRPELARAARRLAESGTPIQGASDHGISEAIYLPDPDGNGIELAADRGREHWGDLRDPATIGPRPLDLRGLVGSVASEEPAPNADRDLRVGHLHLHVGDVDEALTFYRDLIGFEVMTRFEGAAFVAAGGYHHHLGLNTWRGVGAPGPPDDVVGLERWTVLIGAESIEPIRRRLDAAGVPHERAGDGIVAADPWGIRLRIAPPADRTVDLGRGDR
jgi:catechol 2,3-dioxygenase